MIEDATQALRGTGDAIGTAAAVTALALTTMMAAQTLAAWQAGRFDRPPAVIAEIARADATPGFAPFPGFDPIDGDDDRVCLSRDNPCRPAGADEAPDASPHEQDPNDND